MTSMTLEQLRNQYGAAEAGADQIREMDSDGAMVAVLNKSEIDQQIATARKYPRSIKRFHSECLDMVTLNEHIASECIYALPRGGKTIEGPSARFAEVVASSWGNCRAGARVVNIERDFVVTQGVFHDLERNVSITYEVKRRITDKNGKRYNDDMIGVTANAGSSIALRNAILKGVPKAFWGPMYDAARLTVVGNSQTLANRRSEAVAYLQKFGVTQEMICNTLGVDGIEDIGGDELVTLRGIATAIKDGDTTVDEAFQVSSEKSKSPEKAQQPAKKNEQEDQSTKSDEGKQTKASTTGKGKASQQAKSDDADQNGTHPLDME